jgi:putative phosphoesterase
VKVALIADIHGNADAMAAVVGAFRRENVDKIIVAGDLVGYYYYPDRVLELLSGWECVMVRGNHEDMLAAWSSGACRDVIVDRYGSGLEAAERCLTRRQVEELTNLPMTSEVEIDGQAVLVCHGAPWNNDEYVYPDADIGVRRRLTSSGHDLVIAGHTHYPLLWKLQGCTVVNPGSVGQPRDRIPGACWALWDTMSGVIDLRREGYDTSSLVAECHKRDPHLRFIADVLTRS